MYPLHATYPAIAVRQRQHKNQDQNAENFPDELENATDKPKRKSLMSKTGDDRVVTLQIKLDDLFSERNVPQQSVSSYLFNANQGELAKKKRNDPCPECQEKYRAGAGVNTAIAQYIESDARVKIDA